MSKLAITEGLFISFGFASPAERGPNFRKRSDRNIEFLTETKGTFEDWQTIRKDFFHSVYFHTFHEGTNQEPATKEWTHSLLTWKDGAQGLRIPQLLGKGLFISNESELLPYPARTGTKAKSQRPRIIVDTEEGPLEIPLKTLTELRGVFKDHDKQIRAGILELEREHREEE